MRELDFLLPRKEGKEKLHREETEEAADPPSQSIAFRRSQCHPSGGRKRGKKKEGVPASGGNGNLPSQYFSPDKVVKRERKERKSEIIGRGKKRRVKQDLNVADHPHSLLPSLSHAAAMTEGKERREGSPATERTGINENPKERVLLLTITKGPQI